VETLSGAPVNGGKGGGRAAFVKSEEREVGRMSKEVTGGYIKAAGSRLFVGLILFLFVLTQVRQETSALSSG
jgi:hypothetical protein